MCNGLTSDYQVSSCIAARQADFMCPHPHSSSLGLPIYSLRLHLAVQAMLFMSVGSIRLRRKGRKPLICQRSSSDSRAT